MGIYNLMRKNWSVYCLISAITYIEEMSKPKKHLQIKNNRRYFCFNSIRLKMKDPEFVNTFFNITKVWEEKKEIKFIGESFKQPRKENFSGQDLFYLSPLWLNAIISKCGKLPNRYSFETAINRISAFKKCIKLNFKKRNLFNRLFLDKTLAAGVFIASMDLEFRGIQQGRLSLCMSKKYKDFLEFMLKVAKKWGWTNNQGLSPVSIKYNLDLGIKASPQYEFRISIKGLREIYKIAGPLTNSFKDKCINFHVNRSRNYVHRGYHLRDNNPKKKILDELKRNKDRTTTDLQFITGSGTDVVTEHLHKLEKEGKVKKLRKGKRYIWNIK